MQMFGAGEASVSDPSPSVLRFPGPLSEALRALKREWGWATPEAAPCRAQRGKVSRVRRPPWGAWGLSGANYLDCGCTYSPDASGDSGDFNPAPNCRRHSLPPPPPPAYTCGKCGSNLNTVGILSPGADPNDQCSRFTVGGLVFYLSREQIADAYRAGRDHVSKP